MRVSTACGSLRVATTVGFAILCRPSCFWASRDRPLAWRPLTVKATPSYNACVVSARTVRLLAMLVLAVLAPPALAQEASQAPLQASGLPLPRFVSLRAEEVNMRAGPGVRYPVDWVYKRKNMPVEVIAEFGTWRKVRDIQGTQGWIHQSMLSSNR